MFVLLNIGIVLGCNCAGRLIASLGQFIIATFNDADKVALILYLFAS